MKKLLFTFFYALAFLSFASAQVRYTLTPNPASGTGTIDQADAEVDAEIHNLTGQTLQLHWVRNVISLTPGCETAVCDAVTCYSRTTSSHNFNLYGDTTRPFIVHFYNNGAPCAGIVHVKVTNNNDPADSVNVVFLFNQNSAVKDLPTPNVKLYPNPVTEYFSLEHAENVAVIRVFTIEGREVIRYNVTERNYYSLQGQAAGNYIIALEDKNGQAFQALELSKE